LTSRLIDPNRSFHLCGCIKKSRRAALKNEIIKIRLCYPVLNDAPDAQDDELHDGDASYDACGDDV
jgi:hypothetical protein